MEGDVRLAPGLLFWPAVTARFSERGKSSDDLKAVSFLAGKHCVSTAGFPAVSVEFSRGSGLEEQPDPCAKAVVKRPAMAAK